MSTKAQYIQLLEEQISDLESDQFDLDAWKGATLSILQRIFGAYDEKVRLVKNIRVEFGSWSLRDARGNSDPVASARMQGKSILQSAIRELRIFEPAEEAPAQKIPLAWQHILSAEQYASLQAALQKEDATRKEGLKALFDSIDKGVLSQLLTSSLLPA